LGEKIEIFINLDKEILRIKALGIAKSSNAAILQPAKNLLLFEFLTPTYLNNILFFIYFFIEFPLKNENLG